MGYVLRKVKNDQSPVYNRWFARVDRPGTLSTRGLAQHMIEHGLVGNRADVESMLSKLSECIPELVAQGYGVKLDGIGIFYPTIKNRKGGAASVTEFTISENVEGVRFRFRPDSTDLDDLTAKAFGKKVSFGNGYYQTETFGKKVSFGNGYYQTESGKKAPKIPLAAAENPQP